MRTLIIALFFLSGCSGLVYQVSWVRRFGDLFGNTVHSAALVTALFMCGLGVGGYLAGRFADRVWQRRSRSLLGLYGVCEIGIGVFGAALALALPHLARLASLSASYAVSAEGHLELSSASVLMRYGVAIAALAPVTLLMGATLPLLIRHLMDQRLQLAGWRVGLLYGYNTLGAAAGALATDALLVPGVGVRGAQLSAAALNLLVGVAALALARSRTDRRTRSVAAAAETSEPVETSGGVSMRDLGVAAAIMLSGFAGMGVEVLWFRILITDLGALRATFSLLLTVILIGMWLGAIAGGALHRRFGRPSLLYALSQALFVALALYLLGGLARSEVIGRLADSSGAFEQAGVLGRALIGYGVNLWPTIKLAGPPALMMGAAFPLANACVQRVASRVGARAGALYLANTAGAVLGSIVTGFVLLPALGSRNSALFLAAAALIAAAVLTAVAALGQELAGRAARVVAISGLLAASISIAVFTSKPADHLARDVVKPYEDRGGRVLSLHEGTSETLAVVESGASGRVLVTNGHNMSSTLLGPQRYMRAFVHIPLLLREAPTRVLVICFGVGNTAHAASLHPSVREIELVDISRDVIAHAGWFSDANHGVIKDTRARVFINDGRAHLRMAAGRDYDLVTLEAPPLSHAGVSALYSREFYRSVERRLQPGGLLTQWLPAYQVPAPVVRSIIRSFVEVFPGAVLLSGYRRQLILVGAQGGPVQIELSELGRRLQQRPAVGADLERIQLGTLTDLIGTYVAGPRTLGEVSRDAAPVTDDWPVLEYAASSQLVSTRMPEKLFASIDAQQLCPDCYVNGRPAPSVADLDVYLALLEAWYRTDTFLDWSSFRPPAAPQLLRPRADEAAMRAVIWRYPYLRGLFGHLTAPAATR